MLLFLHFTDSTTPYSFLLTASLLSCRLIKWRWFDPAFKWFRHWVGTGSKDLVSWCSEPSQPPRVPPGLDTNINPSPSYSAQTSSNHKKTERAMGAGRRTREEIVEWNQVTVLRFQTRGRHQTSPASPRAVSKIVAPNPALGGTVLSPSLPTRHPLHY